MLPLVGVWWYYQANLPDFRSAERTFQLLDSGGWSLVVLTREALNQTYNPSHYAIRFAQQQDYEAFYAYEGIDVSWPIRHIFIR